MMSEIDYCVVLFHSTQGAIKAERALTRAGLAVQLIPTPRQFSSDCGTALRSRWEEVEDVRSALEAANVGFDSIHKMTAHALLETGGEKRG
jgi:hypothetical protein